MLEFISQLTAAMIVAAAVSGVIGPAKAVYTLTQRA